MGPEVYWGVCSVSMAISTVGTWSGNCMCTSCHTAYEHGGICAIHVYI